MDIIYNLNRTLQHIESHLQERLDLEDLADLANYSPWHFHRQFSAIIGYGVGEYIRRRRLSEAARELVFTPASIQSIATKYCFESQAAFTRAFKVFAGITPGQARKEKGTLPRFSPIELTQYAKHFRKGEIIMTPRFEHKDAFTVVGMAGQFTMANNTIPQLWDKFNPRSPEIKNATVDACLGVCYYEPHYEKDAPFTYMAGMIVKDTTELPDGMTTHTVPACDYAVFEHKGSLDTLSKTYDYIFREWLPASEYEMAKQDDFEWYDERFIWGDPASVFEIWIPIRKKA